MAGTWMFTGLTINHFIQSMNKCFNEEVLVPSGPVVTVAAPPWLRLEAILTQHLSIPILVFRMASTCAELTAGSCSTLGPVLSEPTAHFSPGEVRGLHQSHPLKTTISGASETTASRLRPVDWHCVSSQSQAHVRPCLESRPWSCAWEE